MAKIISKVEIAHILKVDSFAQQFVVDHPTQGKRNLIEGNEDFFKFIYSFPKNSIYVNNNEYAKDFIDRWLNENILNPRSSLLLIIEGYAGCGKSTWVQSILYNIFGKQSYAYSYYNYNIGSHPNNEKTVNPIKESLIADLIEQMIRVLLSSDGRKVFEKFELLTKHKDLKLLDYYTTIWNYFSSTLTIKSCVNRLLDLANTEDCNDAISDFRVCAYEQLTDNSFDVYRLLCVDYLWRLAQFITNPDKYRNNFYVCYDNLDAIYDNELLSKFRDNLLQFRYNLDEFITAINLESKICNIQIPPFVIFTTYRKITEVRSDISNPEMIDDVINDPAFVKKIEVSKIYDYKSIVQKRIDHFSAKLKTDCIFGDDADLLQNQMDQIEDLLDLDFVKKYSDMWNYNYRSCGNVFGLMVNNYPLEMKTCRELLKKKNDGYNDEKSCYYGASSVFLYVVCDILADNGIWGPQYLDLTNHKNNTYKYPTSLSRLILNYLCNNTEDSTSVEDIFNSFDKVFDYKYICKILGQMLKRARDELWRRPIYYAKNAFINESSITNKFINQYDLYKKGLTNNLVEISICEGGRTFVEKIAPHFEFYSTRLNSSGRPLYCINSMEELEKTIEIVYEQIKTCCRKQDEFRTQYMKQYNISNKEYLMCIFHSRTKAGNLQLHIERVIFSHISYLNNYRLYLIKKDKKPRKSQKTEDFNSILISYIDKYLELYETEILPISSNRKEIAAQMRQKINMAIDENSANKYLSIDVDN